MSINDFENYYLTWKPNKEKLKKPYYKSISHELENDIKSNKLKPDTQLPPQRELADYLDIHFTTITKAYKVLENKKLIYGVVGKGTFVSNIENKGIVKNSNREITDLAFVSNFDETNIIIDDFIKKRINKINYLELLTYNDAEGTIRQKLIAADWLKYLGLENFTPEDIIISSGGQNALSIVLLSLFNPYDKIVVDYYTYANFIELAQSFNITLVPIHQDQYGMNAKKLDNICSSQNIKGIFLMPNRSNPTNIKISNTRKIELVNIINKYNLILIEDETFTPFAIKLDNEYIKPIFNEVNNGIYISSTSKYISSGLRVGYIIPSKHLKEAVSISMSNINVKTSPIDTELVTQIIESGLVNKLINAKIQKLLNVNTLYRNIFKDDDSLINFYKWLEVKNINASKILYEEKKVLTLPSHKFSPINQNNKHFLRISLSTVNIKQLEYILKFLSLI